MTGKTAGKGRAPADSPPEVGVCITDEGWEGLEALHEVVEVWRAQHHLGRVALPQNLPIRQKTVGGMDSELQARATARIQSGTGDDENARDGSRTMLRRA